MFVITYVCNFIRFCLSLFHCSNESQTIVICIGGNIAAGKTTQLQLLNNKCHKLYEPVDTLWNKGLTLMYQNPIKYTLTFQLQVQTWFTQHITKKINNIRHENNSIIQQLYNTINPQKKFIIIERSYYDSKYVFGNIALQNKMIDEYQYNTLYEFTDALSWQPDIYIYIRTPVHTCYKRLVARNRKCELQISKTYLDQICHNYEQLMQILQKEKIQTYIINGNQTQQQIHTQINKILTSQ